MLSGAEYLFYLYFKIRNVKTYANFQLTQPCSLLAGGFQYHTASFHGCGKMGARSYRDEKNVSARWKWNFAIPTLNVSRRIKEFNTQLSTHMPEGVEHFTALPIIYYIMLVFRVKQRRKQIHLMNCKSFTAWWESSLLLRYCETLNTFLNFPPIAYLQP